MVRDHIGVRPLCYSIKNDQLLFASHEFGIAKSNLIDITLSEEYLIQSFHPNNKQNYCLTVFTNINKVLPGHSLSISHNKQEYRKYWYPEKIKKDETLSFEHSVTGLRHCLVKATVARMGQGLLGAHISGGLDSSGIAAIVADNIENKNRLIGYSWSPEESMGDVGGLNEKELIEDFAKQKGVNISYMTYCDSTLIDDYILPEFEQMPIELFTMRKACNDGVSTIFSGWGGDEFVSLSLRGSLNHIVFRFKLRALIRWIKHFGIIATIARARGEILPLLVPFGLLESGAFKRYGLKYFKKAFIVKHWKLFFFNRKKNYYGWGDRNRLMLKLIYNYHLPQRMDSWAMFGEKYGIEYKFPLLDKELLDFWFTVPIKYTYERMSYRCLYREAMKGILTESIRMRTNKDEAVFQKRNKLRKQKIKEKLVNRPDIFSESPYLKFFKTRTFQKLAANQLETRIAFNLQMFDLHFFLRYKSLVEKYVSKNHDFSNVPKED